MDPDFDRFEKKVDEIERIIKGLCSKDNDEASKAECEADSYLDGSETDEDADEDTDEDYDIKVKKKFDRTVVNKQHNDSYDGTLQTQAPDAFMAYVEKDAKARAADRRRRYEVASKYRNAGNDAFALGDFPEALDQYTKAIHEVKDNPVLYVSRAVTYLKLGLHKRMIDDCEWALKVNENCLRGWLLKGRAHFELDDVEEADKCLQEALKRNPHRKKDIDAYAAQWRWRKTENENASS